MVDRSKELYQQQLAAHAAWANFGAGGYSPAPSHGGFGGGGDRSMGAAAAAAAAGGTQSMREYENYMQRLQAVAGLSGGQHGAAGSMFGSNFLGNGAKDMAAGFSPFLPGHPMHFPGLANYPLPAHSPLPAHMKTSSATPLPAHMRSSPYQQGSYHAPPYGSPYNMAGPGYSQQPPVSAPAAVSPYPDPEHVRAMAGHNGSSLLAASSVTSAYSQLQQLSAAYSQAASAKEAAAAAKKLSSGAGASVTTANNNYPYSPQVTSTSPAPPHYSTHTTAAPASNSSMTNDQIAAALMNRFSGQFNSQFMSEMVKSAQPAGSPAAAAGLYPPLSVPSFTSAPHHRDTREHEAAVKPPPPSKPALDIAKTAPDPIRPDPVTSLKRPPDPSSPGPGRGALIPPQHSDGVRPAHAPAPAPTLDNGVSKPGDGKHHVNNNEKHGESLSSLKPANKINSAETNHSSVSTTSSEPSRPAPPPVTTAAMSITNKIKELQSRQATGSSSAKHTAASDDRSELKGLWRLQAQLFQQKSALSKPKAVTSSSAQPVTTSAASEPAAVATSSTAAPVTSVTSSSSSRLAPPRVSAVSSPSPVPVPEAAGPPLLHTPRSPPHPPPPRPHPQPPQYPRHYDVKPPYNPPSQPYSTSSHSQPYYTPPSTYHAPSHYTPPPPTVPVASSTSYDPSRNYKPSEPIQNSNQNERMEVKNSGIPGPSAISWKRKSLEDSPSSGNVTKKRKVNAGDTRDRDDPYSFDDDDKCRQVPRPSEVSSEQTNGGVATSGFKYKSALLSRENDVDSDESSISGSGSPSKKKKRPKMEEWSVNKEKKNKAVKSPSRGSKVDIDSDKEPTSDQGSKKSPLWGLPNVAKPPVKTEKVPEKPKPKVEPEKEPEKPSNKGSVNPNVWLQAFGAGDSKSKKKEAESTTKSSNGATKAQIKTEKEEVAATSTILDIPPEVRRKSRPKFGGLIHFDPDWNRGVRRHHERCRVPTDLENSSLLKPKILAGHQTPKKNYEDQARKAMVSPPNMLAIEKERMEKAAVTVAHKLPSSVDDELSGDLPSIVETILENRKKLREATDFERVYKVPFMKEKKKRMMRAPVQNEVKYNNVGLLPTPGLPLLTADTKDVLLGSGFGNFRQYTLTKALQNEAKWSEVPEIKPRRQANSSKPVINIKEIFGMETPGKKSKKPGEEKSKKIIEEKSKKPVEIKAEPSTTPSTPVKKEKKRKTKQEPESSKSSPSPIPSTKSGVKFVPKFKTSLPVVNEPEEECGYSHEVGEPTEKEKNLQFDLGGFALDLLEDNPSWSKQVAIQNLVIWEPTEPVVDQSKKKKGKKRSRKSGLDFKSSKRKSKSVAASRAGSPVEEDVREISYSLDNVIAESGRWVIDKNAGETILHRASKMGYPDVAAYALDLASPALAPGDRDYAGLTPLHKAALKGNSHVAKILLSYGADPSAGVKGTRALHEGNIDLT